MKSQLKWFCYVVISLISLSACTQKRVETSFVRGSSEGDAWTSTFKTTTFFSTDKQLNKRVNLLNQVMLTQRKTLEKNLKEEAVALFDELKKEKLPLPAWKYELHLSDSTYLVSNKYISCLMKASIYTGGAHFNHKYYAYNYDVEKRTFLFPKAILDYNKEAKINKLLHQNFDNAEGKFTKDPNLKNVTVINFTSEKVIFTYAEYLLGPYAAGACSVAINRSEMEDCLLLGK